MKHIKTKATKVLSGAEFIQANRIGLSAWYCPKCNTYFQQGDKFTQTAFCSGF